MEIFDRQQTVVDGSRARYAAAVGAVLWAILNIGRFFSWEPSQGGPGMLAFSVNTVEGYALLSLIVVGPIYAWLIARLFGVTRTAHGLYLGAATVALFQNLLQLQLGTTEGVMH
jgi:hypothetical protein